MNFDSKEMIEKYAQASHAGILSFPEFLGRLVELGVESYFVDYRDQSTTYYLSSNKTLRISMEMPPVEIPNTFNKDGIVSAIRGAQSDAVKYPEFLTLTMSAGCIGYTVWIFGRHVSYFGGRGEVHIEHFPGA